VDLAREGIGKDDAMVELVVEVGARRKTNI